MEHSKPLCILGYQFVGIWTSKTNSMKYHLLFVMTNGTKSASKQVRFLFVAPLLF